MTIQQRRAKVAALVHDGLSERAIAKKIGVSRSTVWSDKQANKSAPARTGGHHL